MVAAGVALLVLPALYAGLMGWLSGGWQRNLTPQPPSPKKRGEPTLFPGTKNWREN